MNHLEHSAVRLVARLAPWLAPLPNAYFVARSAMLHLAVPLWMALVIGAVLELLGLAAVHTALSLHQWNSQPAVQRDHGWQRAPLALALLSCAVYLLAVLFLSVVLEALPALAPWAPALFPLITAVGALTLALISQHDARIERYCAPKSTVTQSAGLRTAQVVRPTPAQNQNAQRPLTVQNAGQQPPTNLAQHAQFAPINAQRRLRRDEAYNFILGIYSEDPHASVSDIARALSVHRNTIYNYLDELESAGRLSRSNGHGVRIP
jgi:hypothetical protein